MSDDIEAVKAAELRLAAAHLCLDVAVVDELLHPDYVILQPGGRLETKAHVLDTWRTDTRRWDKAQVDEMTVKQFDGTAVVIGRWQASGRNGDQWFDYTARFLSIWLKSDGRWRNIAYQSTRIHP